MSQAAESTGDDASEGDSGGADDASGTTTVSTDAIYDVLTDRRRRYTIHYLKQRDGPVPVRDIAEQVAAWENRKPTGLLDAQERKRVYISLYQYHLPSMDDMGLIAYDEDAKTVELRDSLEDVEIYIEVVPEYDIPWTLYYLGLSAANAVLLGLAWLDVAPFDRLPEIAVGAIVLASFALSTLAQLAMDDRKQFGQAGPPPSVDDREADGEANSG